MLVAICHFMSSNEVIFQEFSKGIFRGSVGHGNIHHVEKKILLYKKHVYKCVGTEVVSCVCATSATTDF